MSIELIDLPDDAPLPAPHVPSVDSREPLTRRRLMFFDRVKVLLLIALVLAFAVAKRRADIPIMSLGEAVREQLQAKQWLLWVALLEVIRQIHYLFAERYSGYHLLWQRRVWGRWEHRMSRLDPWMRYRLGRLTKVAIGVTIASFFLGFLWHISPVQAAVQAPSKLWRNAFSQPAGLPFIFTIGITLMMAMGQFAAIFWFMSRGGVDTYMPQEVKTRFSDVWGQDKVLTKVQENIMFLEKPELIEAKGGHVPGGILLWGPPGTGKTLMAEAVAGETGRPYVFVDPGAFQNMFFGVGILKVKSLFRKLRKLALRHGGVIVFFDEADSLGNRGGAVGGSGAPPGGIGPSGFDLLHQCNGLHYVSGDAAMSAQSWALQQQRAEATPVAAPSGLRGIVATGMGGGGGMGTLQALLTELSGLKKPRGWMSRRIRSFLTMPPKQPPKYRLLVMMATNMPDALDEALLRPGRIDRIYKVDYPSLEGRKRTFEGYLDKVQHAITADQVERIALMSPRATGATIKDVVNEALIIAMRNGRDTVTWPDLLAAKQLKTHGMPDEVHPMALERHAVALHEASHAVAMYRLLKRHTIDIATIEPRGPVGGFVAPVPLEEEGFPWRSTREADIVTFLASLAGERHFYGGDNSVGVGGDLRASTGFVMGMLGSAAMGDSLVSRAAFGQGQMGGGPKFFHEVDAYLHKLLEQARELIVTEERYVMAVAHALEQHKTITGEDVVAIFTGGQGPMVNGAWYQSDGFVAAYRAYHEAALQAHHTTTRLTMPLPEAPEPVMVPVWSNPADAWSNGNGHQSPAELPAASPGEG
jgi:ATP-dependent Zn protease